MALDFIGLSKHSIILSELQNYIGEKWETLNSLAKHKSVCKFDVFAKW